MCLQVLALAGVMAVLAPLFYLYIALAPAWLCSDALACGTSGFETMSLSWSAALWSEPLDGLMRLSGHVRADSVGCRPNLMQSIAHLRQCSFTELACQFLVTGYVAVMWLLNGAVNTNAYVLAPKATH